MAAAEFDFKQFQLAIFKNVFGDPMQKGPEKKFELPKNVTLVTPKTKKENKRDEKKKKMIAEKKILTKNKQKENFLRHKNATEKNDNEKVQIQLQVQIQVQNIKGQEIKQQEKVQATPEIEQNIAKSPEETSPKVSTKSPKPRNRKPNSPKNKSYQPYFLQLYKGRKSIPQVIVRMTRFQLYKSQKKIADGSPVLKKSSRIKLKKENSVDKKCHEVYEFIDRESDEIECQEEFMHFFNLVKKD